MAEVALRGTPCSLTAQVHSYFLGQNLGKTWHRLKFFLALGLAKDSSAAKMAEAARFELAMGLRPKPH
jgi:hypothetical protein